MKLHKYFVGLAMAGMFLWNPAKGLTSDTFPTSLKADNKVAEKTVTEFDAQQGNPNEYLQVVAVDYCYAGSTVDPTTGEVMDFYTLCSNDAIGGNFDIG
jgi:hypothetical protein